MAWAHRGSRRACRDKQWYVHTHGHSWWEYTAGGLKWHFQMM